MIQSNRLRLQTLTCSAKIDASRFRTKRYTHFDNKISINRVINDITNPCWVTKHGFYPFIHFKIEFFKYNKEKKERKSKTRDIYYASHIDSYIYKYYGDKLNDKYNDIVKKLAINEVATAYRNNSSGKSNIHFAKEVIDFIKSQKNAFIYVADFTKFFDELDHKYLKRQIQVVLEEDKLPDDYYSVFKNITKFSWAEKEKIEAVLKKKYRNKDKRKKLTRYFDEKDFRKFRSSDNENIKFNKNEYGIPQGAGLSSVCSNIYLLDFDKNINEYVKGNNGLYRRYCDDLIIVIPFDGEIEKYDYNVHMEFVEDIKIQTPRLIIQQEKTKKFIYSNSQIFDESFNKGTLDYLGFSFDGHNVKIREKSLFKFYSRAYRKVRLCNWKADEHERKKHRKGLYKNYTHLGKTRKEGYGNFISYVSRAQKIFDVNATTHNLMETQVENHWKNITKRLNDPSK
ncbi:MULTISPECIES: reverse transcriptase domain-containing protein [Paenibacillus]|uniref:reverse transcriptase domain-containing protein n=1 Tax=Paenibacillus TaxID=44249 RepID=UPI00215AE1C9|nr:MULTISPECIES: reverse transcriptase domain-containing protein [Paenibacillus]QYK70168.1 Reverse transcriptase (RNA-dependent DNA polymerase) [Paenibacillus sp. S02]